jgi:hypothetical protein
MGWDKNSKPLANVCPEKFCFFWNEEGFCRRTFGECFRDTGDVTDKDWYEPCEPELELHGLPWFYFIPSGDRFSGEAKDKYLRESAKLWGTSQESTTAFDALNLSIDCITRLAGKDGANVPAEDRTYVAGVLESLNSLLARLAAS